MDILADSYVPGDINPHLCARCKQAFRHLPKAEEGELDAVKSRQTLHFQSFRDLEMSSLDGCHLCHMFLLYYTEQERNQMRDFIPVDGPTYGTLQTSRLSWNRDIDYITLKMVYPRPEQLDSSCYLPNLGMYYKQSYQHESSPSVDPNSMWKFISRKLTDCLNHHEGCMKRLCHPTILPSRLVFVGIKDDFSDVNICSSTDLAPGSRYLTLSHCWGPHGVPVKLLAASLADYERQLPWTLLPQTFKDAIIVTRHLTKEYGVSHIWIDALCITQDSVEDWRRVSAVMGDIYTGSLCNLAACLGSDGTYGLFSKRDRFAFHGCIIEADLDIPSGQRIRAPFILENSELVYPLLQGSHLLSRGWVLQELYLSPRLVYFTSQRLYWECASKFCCEYEYQIGAPNDARDGCQKIGRFDSLLDTNQPAPSEARDLELRNLWVDIVNIYTSRSLTYSTDKLIAISGLAKLVCRNLTYIENDYLAGLWRRFLTFDLLWAKFANKATTKPTVYRAPTWSWANADCETLHFKEPSDKCSALVQIISADVECAGNDPFGQIMSGIIRIKGPLFGVQIGDLASKDILTDWGTLAVQGIEISSATSLDYCMYPCQVYGTLIQQYTEWGHEKAVGLLLERAEGSRGRYMRCGYFTMFAMQVRVEDCMKEKRDVGEYEEAHDDGSYSFSLV